MGSVTHYSEKMVRLPVVMTAVYVVVLSTCTVSALKFDQDKGIYLDPHMMSAICTHHSEIGEKMEMAHEKCNGGEEEDENSQGKEQSGWSDHRREDTCAVDFGLVFDFFNAVWEKKACVLREAGWVDEAGNILAAAIAA